jgi:hypothetical protein
LPSPEARLPSAYSVRNGARRVQLRNLGPVRFFDCAGIESKPFRVALVHSANDAHDDGTGQLDFLKLRYRVKALGQGFPLIL